MDNNHANGPTCWDSFSSIINFLSCGVWPIEQDQNMAGGINKKAQTDFNGGEGVVYNDRLLASFGIEHGPFEHENKYLKFFRLMGHSRNVKKPVLLVLIDDPTDDT